MAETRHLVMEGLQIRVGEHTLVHDVNLRLESGAIVALVGRSGSGKTLTARSLLGLVDLDPGVVAGQLRITDGNQVHCPYTGVLGGNRQQRARAFAGIRGRLVSYLPQDARAALDPLSAVGKQVRAAARAGERKDTDPKAWLRRAGVRDAERVADLYPHELSGGMAQRVVIAQSLAIGSRFLIADEPTTALDPTVKMDVIEALRGAVVDGAGLLLITHDLRLLPELANEVLIIDKGTVTERARPNDFVDDKVQSAAAQRILAATRRIAGGRLG